MGDMGINSSDLHQIARQWLGSMPANSNQLYGDPSTWTPGQYPAPQAPAATAQPAAQPTAPSQMPQPANSNVQVPLWQQQLETAMAMEQFPEAERGTQGASLPSAEEMWAKMQTPRAPQATGDPYAKQDVLKDPRNENNPPSE